MTRTLLFCTAEEAKPVRYSHLICIRGILKAAEHEFWLLESQECPSDSSGLKSQLADDETYDASAFIGASEEDCQAWYQRHVDKVNFIEEESIAIADARTARDGTILIQYYQEVEGEECPPFGVLPPKADTWYDFRIRPEHTARLLANLSHVASDVSFPRYFGRKEEFTDENGVFDPEKADREVLGDDL
ncbi:hypothetical protein DM02DRAFT_536308 [Periconia macrospinosa]|uniref:Uncharacterized protein n=1 Tax=Periconia macrospinosa TaxID=97972 RepID=A0A2V1DFL1_9PLEO|nr:hypothetical protein DM02DRAFT_536308 [Periconia macrospinosa]